MNLGTDADNAACGQIFERVLADVRNITGDFLRSELGIARFVRIFFNMNRGVNIVADKTFV